MNLIAAKSIPNNTKFIAIYGDGSGADLYGITKEGMLYNANDGMMDVNYPDLWLMDNGYVFWVQIPNTFSFWFEGVGK